ncbi:hypothetical protein GQR58_001058 [Nymphon striatum]|nr:hypothetical protein GQR58_001058 [Nymphon striatum]
MSRLKINLLSNPESKARTTSPNPFDVNAMSTSLTTSTSSSTQKRSAENFLGANSSLVNLDALVSSAPVNQVDPLFEYLIVTLPLTDEMVRPSSADTSAEIAEDYNIIMASSLGACLGAGIEMNQRERSNSGLIAADPTNPFAMPASASVNPFQATRPQPPSMNQLKASQSQQFTPSPPMAVSPSYPGMQNPAMPGHGMNSSSMQQTANNPFL